MLSTVLLCVYQFSNRLRTGHSSDICLGYDWATSWSSRKEENDTGKSQSHWLEDQGCKRTQCRSQKLMAQGGGVALGFTASPCNKNWSWTWNCSSLFCDSCQQGEETKLLKISTVTCLPSLSVHPASFLRLWGSQKTSRCAFLECCHVLRLEPDLCLHLWPHIKAPLAACQQDSIRWKTHPSQLHTPASSTPQQCWGTHQGYSSAFFYLS